MNNVTPIRHYISDCQCYKEGRKLLVETVESIHNQYGLGHITDINFQVLTGNIGDASRETNAELRKASGKYIKLQENLNN